MHTRFTQDGPVSDGGSDSEPNCQLMDGFAVFVQVLLASIALGSLFIKRHRESPQRPLLIWAMDTSKQALAASLIHFANVLVSSVAGIDAEGNEGRSSNPCVCWGLDTTVGVGILYLFLRGLHYLADVLNIPDTQSGVYGTPPRVFPWFQATLYFYYSVVLCEATGGCLHFLFFHFRNFWRMGFCHPWRQLGTPASRLSL
ncbi:hypothetical protein BASA81_014628 [Batrachochytrium salamandrivorans]|nr:hypothetical protein BASA81_014628 [Batrachochytrium salamandrivorans]